MPFDDKKIQSLRQNPTKKQPEILYDRAVFRNCNSFGKERILYEPYTDERIPASVQRIDRYRRNAPTAPGGSDRRSAAGGGTVSVRYAAGRWDRVGDSVNKIRDRRQPMCYNEETIFKDFYDSIRNLENEILDFSAKKKYDSITKQIIKAVKEENPKEIYRAPMFQNLLIKLYIKFLKK